MIIVPYSSIDSDALRAIAEEFVSREGTDYGEFELSMEQKLEQLMSQIRAGRVLIAFDESSESINLVSDEDYRKAQSDVGGEHE